MSNHNNQPLLVLYAGILHLYPSRFRRQFSDNLMTTFADLLDHRGRIAALSVIFSELLPTLIREHLDDPSSLAHFSKIFLCLLPPLGLYAAVLASVTRFEEFFVITFWLGCILATLWRTDCRGANCLLHTMVASILGLLFPLAIVSSYQPMFPGFLTLATPLSILALTVGLILAAYARLVMEGIAFKSTARARR